MTVLKRYTGTEWEPVGGVQLSGAYVAPATICAWYKASDIALADAASVKAWVDRSGQGNHIVQVTAGAQPTYKTGIVNGKPVVRFDGGDKLTLGAGWPLRTYGFRAATVLIVGNLTDAASDRNLIQQGTSGGFHYRINSTTRMLNVDKASQVNIGTATTAVTAATWQVWELTLDAHGQWAFFINGTAVGSGTNDAHPLATANDVEFFSTFLGDIAECVVANTVLSSADRSALRASLGAEYGITVV